MDFINFELNTFKKISFDLDTFINFNLDLLLSRDQESFLFMCEIQPNEFSKYEIKEKTLFLDRLVKISFPVHYGYILNTLAEDKDPIDVCLISQSKIQNYIKTSSVIEIIPILLLNGVDNGESDPKVIAIPKVSLNEYNTKEHLLNNIDIVSQVLKIINFYNRYKKSYSIIDIWNLDKTIKYIKSNQILN